ncbi:MAG: isoprenylcysteine carboxylmethyltransferase family protein [Deltaproteobacteria bacterium]|nr:isoprenylcysteine carboxylmethyltransferase family protein [Deltaproteobacteria bacterium]
MKDVITAVLDLDYYTALGLYRISFRGKRYHSYSYNRGSLNVSVVKFLKKAIEQGFEDSKMPEVEKRTGSQTTMPKIIVGLAIAAVFVVTGLVFVLARRLGWTLGWIYVGIIVATLTINLACLARWNPELIRRRMRVSKFTKTWDKVWAVLFGLAVIAIYIVAVMEARGRVLCAPGAAWLLGIAIYASGWSLAIWSMVVNPFFEKTVRIQTDHGHRVIDTGPYAFMRHPGYVGFAGWMLSTPLLLASTWAFVPALITVVLLVIRTALEDSTLYAELPGYAEYSTRVRFRLIPGVW